MHRLQTASFLIILGMLMEVAGVLAQQDNTVPSPLKQFKSGIPAKDVKCNYGLNLVMNQFNGEPACVNQIHVERLLAAGWVTLEKFETPYSQANQTKVGITQQKIFENKTSNVNPLNLTKTTINSNVPGNSTSAISSIQLSNGISTPIISPSTPAYVKLLSIGIYPKPLKVGDIPQINATFQNISGNSFYINGGCRATTLFSSITPTSNVQEYPRNKIMCADWQKEIKSNETFTTIAHSELLNGAYQIIRPGMLNVTLTQVTTDQKTGWKIVENITFNLSCS